MMEVILKDTVTHFPITPYSNKSLIIIHLLAADGLLFIELLYIQHPLFLCFGPCLPFSFSHSLVLSESLLNTLCLPSLFSFSFKMVNAETTY